MNNSKRVFRLFGNNSSNSHANRASILFNEKVRFGLHKRYFSIVPIFGRILKLRYIFLGSAVGGGIAVQNVLIKFSY